MMIVALLGIVVNGIGITVGISYAYASAPVHCALVFYFLVVNYECKNVLAQADNSRPETYFSVGFGEFISAHDPAVGRLHDAPGVSRLLGETPRGPGVDEGQPPRPSGGFRPSLVI